MTRIDLTEPTLARLLSVLDADGEQARVVGGAVRDALLGLPTQDVDVATTALPAEVTRRCVAEGWRVVPTGIEHGTVTALVGGHTYEVTTLREDVETDGRHAVVRFGRDFLADAMRRDFTINALSASRDGTVHDDVGGLPDLAERQVRFIGDPDRRIAEDRLRILRFFRFHARFGLGEPDAAGLAAAVRGREGLRELSAERVRAEMLKLLAAPGCVAAMQVMSDAGIAGLVLGGVARPPVLARLVADDPAVDPLLKLGAVGLFVVEDAVRLAERLRLSRAETVRLVGMAAAERLHRPPTDHGTRALVYRLGSVGALDLLRLAAAREGGAGWAEAEAIARTWPVPALPFTGAALLDHGLSPGPRLGRIIAEAERRWVAADFVGEDEQAEILNDTIENMP